MTEGLSSPATKTAGSTETPEALLRSLDDLLERYLNLLDTHQKAQQNLTKHLSSGYIFLARANFSSPNRIRYGQDFYDGRMQATTNTNITHTQPSGSVTFCLNTSRAPTAQDPTDTSPQPAAQSSSSDKVKDAAGSESCPSEGTASKVPCDPIKWFGMFVPQALLDAQSSFQMVISEVPSLASIAYEMKEVEAKVERLRGTLKPLERT